MNTSSNNQKIKMLYLVIKALIIFIFIIGTVTYMLPNDTVNDIYEFEQHHFFLFSFISLVLFVLFLKLYHSISDEGGKLNKEISKIKQTIKDRRSKNSYDYSEEIFESYKGEPIDKKDIPNLKFPQNDILSSYEEKLTRERELNKAMVLGNSYKHKVKIFFKDLKSIKKVETTVWFVDDKHVALKEGMILP